MAIILHLDESEVACRAMRGILSRGNHRLMSVPDSVSAWNLLREAVKFDLIILELKLKGENGIGFLTRLRADPFLKTIPTLVYSSVPDQVVVKKALALGVQNYLIKPYSDSLVYAEITKACAKAWRAVFFEEEKSFCAQMGFHIAMLRSMRERLIEEVELLRQLLPLSNDPDMRKKIEERVDLVLGDAEAAGVWCVEEYAESLKAKVEKEQWMELPPCFHDLEIAKKLLFLQLHPEHVPDCFLTDDEKKAQLEAREKAQWLDADPVAMGPLKTAKTVELLIDNLATCPVMESVAASFQMYADGQASTLGPLAEVVCRDPALSTQVLVAANKLERENMNAVEDPRVAISLLGELRLASLSKMFLTVEERHMQIPPITWPHFWMFNVGVARLAEYTCRYLEFTEIESTAYTAGLIHDVGKLMLLKLFPFGFQAMVTHARMHGIPLHMAEKRYIGMNTREMADHFARVNNLPKVFRNVIRWVEDPLAATEDQELVASVALARHLCLLNHVGYCGDTPHDQSNDIETTDAWQVLRTHVFPSFNLARFQAQVHAHSKELRIELLGRLKN